MSNIIGRMYFRLENADKLVGLFSNNLQIRNLPEVAIRTTGSGFMGSFISSWTDETGPHQANLSISLKENSSEIFTLDWEGIEENLRFWGEGFLISDNILIADYRNFQVIR